MDQMQEHDVEDLLPSSTVAYFNAAAPIWSERYKASPHFQARLEKVLAWVAAYPPQTEILDFGCGSAVLLKSLSAAGFNLTGVDVSPGMLAEARRTMESVPQRERAKLYEVNAQLEGPHAEQTYDGIFCLGVLEYLEDPQALLAHLNSLLKPGGFLIMSFPNQASKLRGVERWIYQNAGLFKPFGLFSHLTGPDNYLQFQRHQFTVKQMLSEIEPWGLSLKRTHYHVAPSCLKGMENSPTTGMSVITEWVKSAS
jgi:2-polyprenyl-3-methyl-5-hydroxy-6-metoxy-1,4-benzoquinol methylase